MPLGDKNMIPSATRLQDFVPLREKQLTSMCEGENIVWRDHNANSAVEMVSALVAA
jgi:hypothetical protein